MPEAGPSGGKAGVASAADVRRGSTGARAMQTLTAVRFDPGLLALAPGGLTEMGLIALAIQAGVALVPCAMSSAVLPSSSSRHGSTDAGSRLAGT